MNTFTDIEAALRKIAADNDLTYVSFELHIAEHSTFYSCNAHQGRMAKSGIGPALETCVAKALESDFLDTAPLTAERDRFEAAGRALLEGRAAA